ncbi:DUF6884 domain-containing protein [Embleya sp. AB8]|uniref:DUF6884 domain-containing protein n=1 Tax=Embleya sp. AB8 TaxID=3156304 RepID=UPI003C71650A
MISTHPTTSHGPAPVVVIPCSHGQLPTPAPAAELYVGSYHRWCRATAEAITAANGGTILILSARYGLLPLDGERVLTPYDKQLTKDHIDIMFELRLLTQARDLRLSHAHNVTILAGATYAEAARLVWPHATAPLLGLGIGYQRQRLAGLRARAARPRVEAASKPPYALPNDWSKRRRTFTVTIAGPERHDGQAPFTVVVEDHSTEKAWAQALAWFLVTQETIDGHVIAEKSYEGLPVVGDERSIVWNDLRSERN